MGRARVATGRRLRLAMANTTIFLFAHRPVAQSVAAHATTCAHSLEVMAHAYSRAPPLFLYAFDTECTLADAHTVLHAKVRSLCLTHTLAPPIFALHHPDRNPTRRVETDFGKVY